MEGLFPHLCEQLSNQLWLQSLLIIIGTCFLEDPARCAVALLVAAGSVNKWLAFVSMILGGMSGDIGLYLIGRYATFFLVRHRWIDRSRLAWMKSYFRSHAAKTVIASRFLPGARSLTFTSAGIVRYPFPWFLLLLFIAATIQAFLFLQLGMLIGERILPYLTSPWLRAAIFLITLCVFYLAFRAFGRRRKKKIPRADPSADEEFPALSRRDARADGQESSENRRVEQTAKGVEP